MGEFSKILAFILRYFALSISFLILFYILAVHLLVFIKPVSEYIDPSVFNVDYLRLLFALGFSLSLVSLAMSFILKDLKFINPFTLPKKEIITYGLIGFLIAIFYNSVFAYLGIIQYPFFAVLCFLIFLAIPQIINLYLDFNFKSLAKEAEKLLSQSIKKNNQALFTTANSLTKRNLSHPFSYLFYILFCLVCLLILVFTFFFVSQIFRDYAEGNGYKENFNNKRFYIKTVNPEKALHTQKVYLKGYNFGLKQGVDARYRLMSTDGPIKLVEEWQDQQLVFTVPLDLPTGKKQIWLEKPTNNPADNKVIKSNSVNLVVFSRFELYPHIDDTELEKVLKIIKRTIYFNVPFLRNIILFN